MVHEVAMSSERKEYVRPFSREYQRVSARPVTRMMDGPFREFVDAAYVAWLESELQKARER